MGPIQQAINALTEGREAMRQQRLVTNTECLVCKRSLIKGGVHTSDCAYEGMQNARRRLLEFQTEVAR